MAREIHIELDDDAYEQLMRLAADSHVDAAKYAGRLLAADLARARFEEGAQLFVAEHAAGFAERFGGGRPGGRAAA